MVLDRIIRWALLISLISFLVVVGIAISQPHTKDQDAGVVGRASVEFDSNGMEIPGSASGGVNLLMVIRDRYKAGLSRAEDGHPWYQVLEPDRHKMVYGARYLVVQVTLISERRTKVSVTGFFHEDDLNQALANPLERQRLGIFGETHHREKLKIQW